MFKRTSDGQAGSNTSQRRSMNLNVEEIIRKIEQVPTEPVNKVASAFSGGLDSCLGIELLRRKYKAKDIVAITIDVGQGAEEMEQSRKNAKALGKANSNYGGYPVSTSMTRQLVARNVAEVAVEHGCEAIIEGSSGKGNDQYRMHNTFTYFAPGLKVLAPVRDFDLTRLEEELLCKAWEVPVMESITGGDDKTLWCRSIASGAIDLDQVLPDDIWMWLVPAEKAADKPAFVEIEFVEGVPVKLDGKAMELDDLIEKLNIIGGANGIGRIDMFEDGIMDLKSREIYEAPAAHIILKLHADLEQFCLTKEEILFKKAIDQKWAYMMYHGEAYQPLRYALEAFIKQTQGMVNGTYKVKLYKGNIEIVSRRSPTSLFSPEIRSIKSTGFNQQRCADAAFVRGLPYMVLAKRLEKIKQ